MPATRESLLQRHPVAVYSVLTYAISWLGALAVAAPRLLRGQPIGKLDGLLMFPVMLLGPSIAGIFLTGMGEGRAGLRSLLSLMCRIRFTARWYAALLIPPGLVLAVLFAFKTIASPAFTPNTFFPGIGFGLLAGFLEEIGWLGYAFPKMRVKRDALPAGILLGLLWGFWHLPVIGYLGAATPHGAYWFHYFLGFVAAMTAMRVLIAWMYSNTNSVFLAQLMHASSTGSLVIFSPSYVTPAQEALWYSVYAAALWIAVAIIAAARGKRTYQPFIRRPRDDGRSASRSQVSPRRQ